MLELRSHLGSTIVCPSRWTQEDNGDTWKITSEDGQATITIWVFRVAATGTMDQFKSMMVDSIMREKKWKKLTEWTGVQIGDDPAWKVRLGSGDDAASESWGVFVLRTGEYYHAIVLATSPTVLRFNGGFYEDVIRSFRGCRGKTMAEPGVH